MNKITIIGSGSVGSTIAYTLTVQGIASEIVMIDINEEKAKGEALDIRQGVPFCTPCSVYAGSYEDAKDSDIVIITSGIARKPGQTRLDLAQTNVNIIKSITPNITKYAPDAIYLFVSNPVDILTYTFCKCSGIPESRILGSGTILDTARLRARLSEYYQINQQNVHAYVLGEHGDSQIAAFSAATVCGKPLTDWMAEQPDTRGQADLYGAWRSTVAAGWDIVQGKGCTEFGIGAAAAAVIKAILHDEKAVLPCSTLLDGPYGQHGVYASVPCILGAAGVEEVIELTLSRDEAEGFAKSCAIIREHCEKL